MVDGVDVMGEKLNLMIQTDYISPSLPHLTWIKGLDGSRSVFLPYLHMAIFTEPQGLAKSPADLLNP
jgi:hypothetical protein